MYVGAKAACQSTVKMGLQTYKTSMKMEIVRNALKTLQVV